MPELVQKAVARLLAMISWIGLQPDRTVTLRQLADHFGRTPRQVRRDLEHLGEVRDSLPGASFEIDWALLDEAGLVHIRSTLGADQPPALTGPEAAAILVGLRAVAPGLEAEQRALVAPTALAIAALARREDAATAVASATDPASTGHEELLATLRVASAERRTLRFTYASPRGVRERVGVALDVSRGEESWIVRMWAVPERAVRSFRLDRMRDVREAPEEAPPADEVPVVELREDTPERAAAERTHRPPVRLTIRRTGQWLLDVLSHTRVAEDEDTVTVDVPVWNVDTLVTRIIQAAPHVVSIEDDALVDAVERRAEWILTHWEVEQ